VSRPVRPIDRDFTASRTRFLAAAQSVGAKFEEIVHPLDGPNGEPLSADVALVGDEGAKAMLVLITGVHGVEHYAGSACICEWMEQLDVGSLPAGLAVLVVHAINPWGAAWCRRYTEDNVDLARNFSDFDQSLEVHEAYEEIHGDLAEMKQGQAEIIVQQLAERLGEQGAIEALMRGQYSHPDGFSFGGHKPTWSNRTITSLLTHYGAYAERFGIVEFHSGLGPWAEVLPVSMHTGGALERVRSVYGDGVIAPRVEEGRHSAPGHTTDGYLSVLEGREVTSIVLEFGTYPPSRSLPVLLEDHRVHTQGLAKTPAGREVAAANLEMHCPADHDWQRTIISRGTEMIERSIEGLQKCH
jgi:hypothetical protein